MARWFALAKNGRWGIHVEHIAHREHVFGLIRVGKISFRAHGCGQKADEATTTPKTARTRQVAGLQAVYGLFECWIALAY